MSEALGKVAVLLGGNSAEREVSLASGHAVLRALQARGINAEAFDPAERSLTELSSQGFSRAFIALHGRGGEDGSMQGALQLLGIPYTGSGVAGSSLAMDKVRTKWIWQAQGLPVAASCVIERASLAQLDPAAIVAELGLPLIVKPALEGSSIGISKVTEPEQLRVALTEALQHDDRILVERWIDGSEYTVAILGDQVLPAVRMETPNSFYDYEAKYQSQSTRYYCPCGLNDQDERELAKLAQSAFDAVGASGWGRVDLMRDSAGNWYLLEVNTVPGMTEKSLVPMAARAAGISFEQLVERILVATLPAGISVE